MEKKAPRTFYNKKKVWLRAFTSSLGYLSFGYANGIFTSSQQCISSLLSWGSESYIYISIISSLIPLGALFGGIFAGYLSRNYGKRKNLMIADLVMILGSSIIVIPHTVTFGLGRFICGIGTGCFSMLCAQYINEFTPTDMSGKMGSFNALSGMTGLLLSFSVCIFLPAGPCEQDIKYYVFPMFAAPGFISLIQFLILYKVFKRESPCWLIKIGEHNLALQSLTSIYDKNYAELQIEKLLESPQNSLKSYEDFSLSQVFTCKKGTTKSSRLGFLFHFFQQISGINVILNYSTRLFEDLGEGVVVSRLLTIFASFLRLIAVLALFPIIDKNGRKPVTIISEFGMACCFFLIAFLQGIDGFKVTLVVFIDIYLMLFAVSLGPICWIYTSEILNDKVMAACTVFNWGTCFILVLTFPLLVDLLGLDPTFFMFGAFNLIGCIYFCIDMVETKGLPKSEIKAMLSAMR